MTQLGWDSKDDWIVAQLIERFRKAATSGAASSALPTGDFALAADMLALMHERISPPECPVCGAGKPCDCTCSECVAARASRQ